MRHIETLEAIIDDFNNQINAAKHIINGLNDDIKDPEVYLEDDELRIRWDNVKSESFPYLEIIVNQYYDCEYIYTLNRNKSERGKFLQGKRLPQNVVYYLDDNFKKE